MPRFIQYQSVFNSASLVTMPIIAAQFIDAEIRPKKTPVDSGAFFGNGTLVPASATVIASQMIDIPWQGKKPAYYGEVFNAIAFIAAPPTVIASQMIDIPWQGKKPVYYGEVFNSIAFIAAPPVSTTQPQVLVIPAGEQSVSNVISMMTPI